MKTKKQVSEEMKKDFGGFGIPIWDEESWKVMCELMGKPTGDLDVEEYVKEVREMQDGDK